MMKVMIVDDEYLIREGLKNAIPWKDYDMEVVATAENGEEGLAMARECRPNLVVTDICMPFIDGLEMSEALLKDYPDTILIILTCYDEFEYARKALKFGAFDYVLKPVDLNVFPEILERARKKHQLLWQKHSNLSAMLSNVIHGREDAGALRQSLESLGRGENLVYCCLLFKLLGFGYAQSILSSEELRAFLRQFGELLDECCGGRELLLEGQEEDGRCVVILGGESREAVEQMVEQICQSVRRQARIRDDYPLLCAISDERQGEESLAAIYRQCKEIAQVAFLYDHTKFIRYSDLDRQEARSEDITNMVEAFSDALRTFDNPTIQAKLREICGNIRGSGQGSMLYGHVFVATVFSGILKVIGEMGVELEAFGEEFMAEYPSIIRMDNLSGQMQKIGDLVERLCRLIQSNKSSPHAAIMQKARSFMDSNYGDSTLSLQRVSAEVHMSPSYFSIVFKQTVGRSFITYLTDLRMEQARHLLRNTDQKVYEISYAVGYDNATYFSTPFKKSFGMGPLEYRQQFAAEAPGEDRQCEKK